MARIRTIKPEFWRHEDLSALPECTHLLAAALLNYADDEGYFNANHKLIQAECFPLREPSVSVHDMLTQLSGIGYIRLGTCPDGKSYGQVIKFLDHQRINRPTPSKFRDLDIMWEHSLSPHTQLTEPSSPERKGREGKGTGKEGADAPAVDRRGAYYAWSGQVIRLTSPDLNRWKQSFSHLDLPAELEARDAWLATQGSDAKKDWFVSTSKYLANRNMEARSKGRPGDGPRDIEYAGCIKVQDI